MKRDLTALSSQEFDLAIVGGGIYGLACAWDAAQRGLSVALLERGDFAAATSWNSLKTIHGGLRYLQHADFKRMRESIHERTALMRIAPHLVHPLRFVLPAYGHGLRGREALAAYLWVSDLIGFDRNRLADPAHRLPRSCTIGVAECLQLLPGLPPDQLSGAGIWHDCQLASSNRLAMALLHSAVQVGAVAANYLEATGLLRRGDRVSGVRARDSLAGRELEVRARLVLNACGPWVNQMLGWSGSALKVPMSKAMNLVVRKMFDGFAVGLYGRRAFRDSDAWVAPGRKTYFITPWRGRSVIGTTHGPFQGDPNQLAVSEAEIEELLSDINQAYPPAQLTRAEVCLVQSGLLPAAERTAPSRPVRLLKHYQLWDHRQRDGLEGLVTVLGVKFTTARHVADRAIDLVVAKLGRGPIRSRTDRSALVGGAIEDWTEFVARAGRERPAGISEEAARRLALLYGSEHPKLLKYVANNPALGEELDEGSSVTRAEVVYGIREEMAQRLTDVVLRRTELGAAGYPGDAVVRRCAEWMAAELGWSQIRAESELAPLWAWRDSGKSPPP